jgi:hypothetical protein
LLIKKLPHNPISGQVQHRSAMQIGDNIIIWSNPTNLKKTKYIDGVIEPSFYERELEFLKNNSTKYNYDYNKGINSGKFSK